ncbi:amidase [Nocardia panacis]|uniref:Amidase n=1 Tax=Nocardia panacis TaxID=2340916 RepID=A0A3A4KQ20_9NOCA|nr:amidase [Nocardia panacis]RJO75110.1 amidase [Nocardia panacis]
MNSDEQRVRALLEVFGLRMDPAELAAIVADYPVLRYQADEIHRTATDGLARDTSKPKVFRAVGSADPAASVTGVTIEAAAAALRAGTSSARELVTAAFARIDQLNDRFGAYVSTFRQSAIAAADQADRELARGVDRGPLHGIPLNIKDVIATVEGPTRANSRVPPPHWRGDRDATVVTRLRAAGAIVLGKTTTNEFALGPNDPASGFPMPRNAWSDRHYAGGSSSGAAIAVASGMSLGAIATDTTGSIRHPAALNGVTGLKVSYGRVPITGAVPLAASLDTVGPIARSARDCALLLQVMAGVDPSDPASSVQPVPNYLAALDGSVRGLRIGLPERYFYDLGNVAEPVARAVRAAVDELRSAGAVVKEVALPNADMARIAATLVVMSEAFAYHRDTVVARWDEYGVNLRGLLARAALFTAADYIQAQRIAAAFRAEVAAVMRECDVLAMPMMPTGARLLDETDPTMMDRYSSASFNSQWNLAGLPACAIPVGFDHAGMPVSMQLVGRPFDEATVLRVADAYQRGTEFHLMVPDD